MTKKIFIHVGPPKTGTSAVQKWLNENKELLLSFGIYYPNHKSDPNGISSGNLDSVCDRYNNGEYIFNENKIASLKLYFEESSFKYLLLSSEFFFQRMNELKKHFPSATLIAYLRDPMEKRESSYNQGVKRHFITYPIPNNFGDRGVPDIITIDNFTKKNNSKDLLLRFYGEKYFHHNSIISDLLYSIGIDYQIPRDSVNLSYQFEALEFKRWINNYTIGNLKHRLDRALQSYDKGISNFSLIHPDNYERQRNHDHDLLKDFFEKHLMADSSIFLQDLKNKPQKPYTKQALTKEQFSKVCDYLLEVIKVELQETRELIFKQNILPHSEFRDIFLRKVPQNTKSISIVKMKQFFFGLLVNKRKTNNVIKDINGLHEIRVRLGISDTLEDADILRHLASFSEKNDNIRFALLLMENSARKRPSGPLIRQRLLEYRDKVMSMKL